MISNNLKIRLITSIFLVLLLILIYKFKLILVYCLIVFGIIALLEFYQITSKILNNKYLFFLYNFLFSVYIFLFTLLFIFFSNYLELKIIIYIILLGCLASDIGGYTFGKTFKGKKLTKLSPNKTYAGSIGALILTTLSVTSLFFYNFGIFQLNIIFIGIIISISCQLGDLLFSFLKRKAKIKDTGNFLPGHGGVLDRLDSIFFGLPIGLISLILLN